MGWLRQSSASFCGHKFLKRKNAKPKSPIAVWIILLALWNTHKKSWYNRSTERCMTLTWTDSDLCNMHPCSLHPSRRKSGTGKAPLLTVINGLCYLTYNIAREHQRENPWKICIWFNLKTDWRESWDQPKEQIPRWQRNQLTKKSTDKEMHQKNK